MSTIEDVTALFKDRVDEMPPISGKLTYGDLKLLRELLRNLLQDVELPGGTNPGDLLITKAYYKAAHSGSTFNRLDTPLEAYDPAILSYNTMNNHVQFK